MFTSLFILKITIAPLMILGVSYLQRRYGDRVGGWLLGLPITTGPFILIIGVQEGRIFAARSIHGVLLGQIALITFSWSYALVAPRTRWYFAITIATLTCLATGFLVTELRMPFWLSSALLITTWLAATTWWPRSAFPEVKVATPNWELPVRIIVSLAVLISLSALAPHLGAKLAGALSTYPVLISVLGVFNHRRFGPGVTIATLKGLMQTLPITMAIIFVLGLVLS
jgi:hypothetical protein